MDQRIHGAGVWSSSSSSSASSEVRGSSKTEELSTGEIKVNGVATELLHTNSNNRSGLQSPGIKRSYSVPNLMDIVSSRRAPGSGSESSEDDNRSLDYSVDASEVSSAKSNPDYATGSSTEPASVEVKVGVPSSQSQSSSAPASPPASVEGPKDYSGVLGPGAMLGSTQAKPQEVALYQRALILHAIGHNPQFAALAKKIIDGAPQERDKLGLLKRCLRYEITGGGGTLTLSNEGSLNSGAVEEQVAKFHPGASDFVNTTLESELDAILGLEQIEQLLGHQDAAVLKHPYELLKQLLGEVGSAQQTVENLHPSSSQSERPKIEIRAKEQNSPGSDIVIEESSSAAIGSNVEINSSIENEDGSVVFVRQERQLSSAASPVNGIVVRESEASSSSDTSEINFDARLGHNPFEHRSYRSSNIQIGKYAECPKEDFVIKLGGKTLTTRAFSPKGLHAESLRSVITAAFDNAVPKDRQQDIASWAFCGTPRVVDGEWTEGYFEFMFSKGKSIKVHLRDLADIAEIKVRVAELAADSANSSVNRWARDTGTRVNELKDKEPGSAMSFLIWSCLLYDQRFVRTHDYDKKFTLKDLENPKALLGRLAEIHRPRQAAEAKKPSPPAPASNPQPPANGSNILLNHVPGAQNNGNTSSSSSSSNSSNSSSNSSISSTASPLSQTSGSQNGTNSQP